MARKKRSKKQNSGFKEKLQFFIAHRLYDGLTLFLLGLAAFTALALLSYTQGDPSLNTAAESTDIQNWAGIYGAYWADFLIQALGLAPLLIVPVSLSWAWHVFRRRPVSTKALRFAALFASIIFASFALSAWPQVNEWLPTDHYGGFIGSFFGQFIEPFSRPIELVSIGVAAILSAWAAVWASAWKGEEWISWAKAIGNFILWCGSMLIYALKSFKHWLSVYGEKEDDNDFFNLKPQRPKMKKDAPSQAPTQTRAEPVMSAPDPAPRGKQAELPIIKPQKAPPKASGALFKSDSTDWSYPPLELLQESPPEAGLSVNENELQESAEMLSQVLADFKVEGDIKQVNPGPVVTLYELEPAPGIKSSRVIGLADDIARSMAAVSVRAAVVPGQNVIGIELPNEERQTVYIRDVFETKEYAQGKAKLPLVLGKDIGGTVTIADLSKMPHLLIAGTTGSGKSVAINTMLLSLLYKLSPQQCRLVMIDPKMLELSVYDDIPHLLTPVITEPGKAIVALKWLVGEMENRYRAMSKLGVRNIDGYNQRMREALAKDEPLTKKVQTGFDPETGKPVFEDQPMEMAELPFIVVIVDEFADLMLVAGKDVEGAIQRLAQMARAAGIHLIMATQRPSVDVITGVIKANFPTRISFSVTSKIDSRTILGEGGAEQLLGMGDMLYMASGGRIKRVHGPFVSDDEVEDVVNHLKSQGDPDYIDVFTDPTGDSETMMAMFGDTSDGEKVDEHYDAAVALVAKEQKASTSYIQRYFSIGYNRAARIIEEMEKQGVVGPANATGKREIYVQDFSDTGS